MNGGFCQILMYGIDDTVSKLELINPIWHLPFSVFGKNYFHQKGRISGRIKGIIDNSDGLMIYIDLEN